MNILHRRYIFFMQQIRDQHFLCVYCVYICTLAILLIIIVVIVDKTN